MRSVHHWIDGKPFTSTTEDRRPVLDPASGLRVAEVPMASPQTIEAAVASARLAARAWSDVSTSRRARVLFTFRDLMERREDELARLVVCEHGKVLADALGEIRRGREVVEFAAGIAQLNKGEFSENVSTDVDCYSIRQPLGVVAGITPFNFPVMVPLWMAPVAIACGNAFILKPSERDPSPSMLLGEMWADAGLPAGVFSVLHGGGETAAQLISHRDIAAISFVGSTPVAREIYRVGAEHGKRVQALGGAKNHMVVLPDADLELAADAAVGAAYGSAGERCMAVSVVVAVGLAADPLVQRIADRTRRLRLGSGLDADADVGPLISRDHLDRVRGYLESGEAAGADIIVDGRTIDPVSGSTAGFFLGPSLLDHVTPSMDVYRDEIFGPVLSVVRVDDLDAAVELVNANAYGNGACIFTASGGSARSFEHRAEAGMVGINVAIPAPVAHHSFGGWKDSLFGDTHVYGPDGVRFYTRNKVVTSRWSGSDSSRHGLHMPVSS